jgi:hypothetical protein
MDTGRTTNARPYNARRDRPTDEEVRLLETLVFWVLSLPNQPTPEEVQKASIALYQAARKVLRNWEKGDLAGAVRDLQQAVDNIDALGADLLGVTFAT